MQTRYRLSLDGVPLDSLSEAIVIEDIAELAPEMAITAHTLADGHGQAVTAVRRLALSLQCRFAIREPDPARRQAVTDRVIRWAAGRHTLTCSTRPGRQLRVRCAALPHVQSSLRWPEALTVTFTADAWPFWTDIRPAILTLSGTSAEGTLRVGGTAPADVSLEAEVTGDALTSLTVSAGSSVLALRDLALNRGAVLTLSRDGLGLTCLMVGGQSILRTMTVESDDCLTCQPGDNAVRVTASGPVRVTLSAWGCWL